jgi:hypothetical protein
MVRLQVLDAGVPVPGPPDVTEPERTAPVVPNDAWRPPVIGRTCPARWWWPLRRRHLWMPEPGLPTYVRCVRCDVVRPMFARR